MPSTFAQMCALIVLDLLNSTHPQQPLYFSSVLEGLALSAIWKKIPKQLPTKVW